MDVIINAAESSSFRSEGCHIFFVMCRNVRNIASSGFYVFATCFTLNRAMNSYFSIHLCPETLGSSYNPLGRGTLKFSHYSL